VDTEEIITKITEELDVCEEYLRREARLDFVLRILEDLMDEVQEAKKKNILLGELEERVRILYHRASTLVALIEQGKKV
jgi:hypothetical protein